VALARTLPLTALVAACGGATPAARAPAAVPDAKACTGSIGLAFKTDGLEVGTRRFELAVFRAPPLTGSGDAAGAVVRVRFFRVIDASSLVVRPTEELRLMQPEQFAKPEVARPLDAASGQTIPYNFFVEPVFDAAGTWGAEVVVTAPWQTAPVSKTITFPIAPASAAETP